MSRVDRSTLARRLERELRGDVFFDAFTRGRYSTDASIYQIMPRGVVVPRTFDDVMGAVQIARDEGTPVIARGAGTSQAGQTIGDALIMDLSKHLTGITTLDVDARTVTVEPGVVLDRLNASLSSHGLFFPVDVATAAQATIGGMAGNNSAGARSIRYGMMADNVRAIDALLADGTEARFGPDAKGPENGNTTLEGIANTVRAIRERESDEITRRLPTVLRHVAGYNLQRVDDNLTPLLIGSEGTLALFRRLHLQLQPIPAHRVLGVCHFPTLHAAMDATQHIVGLGPSAVELADRNLLNSARSNAAFRNVVSRFLRGDPAALLFVEFAGADAHETERGLDRLDELMSDLGCPDSLVRALTPQAQQEVWSVRKAGLNLVMSMKGDAKPVSFIEDCAVPLDRLAEYTDALTDIFQKYGTSGTWYAHASVGCLHIRPILNLKDPDHIRIMRAIAEEAHALVRTYKGSHSGEHGDGIVRSEFLAPMLGDRLVRAFNEVKDAFDPGGLFNPGKIVNPPRMDDRTLFRYNTEYAPVEITPGLDWSAWGGLCGAVEMCNNNGACRKTAPGVMCPSYRATADERDTTRGRANSLRLALTGQLGPEALTSDAMYDTMALCVGCKACRRECPTGVDMARMKIEFLHQYQRHHGISLRDRLIAYLPLYAPIAARIPWLANLSGRSGGRRIAERWLGISAQREMPKWRRDVFRPRDRTPGGEPEVALFVDTFTRYFEPEIARAATTVLEAAGYRLSFPSPPRGRPLCCGRTLLNAGLVQEARREIERTRETLMPYVERGVPIVGLEPSCLLTFRDELDAMRPGPEATALAEHALLFEEFLAREAEADRLRLDLRAAGGTKALLHGHCHQKAFGSMESVHRVLRAIPGLHVESVESTCCGMAGSFGYEAEHYDTSMRIGEMGLFPALRSVDPNTCVIADGTSCRRQIADGTGRKAVHVAEFLDQLLSGRTQPTGG